MVVREIKVLYVWGVDYFIFPLTVILTFSGQYVGLYNIFFSLCFSVYVQLISDAGYQGEITSVSTACQQLEVFSRVLRTSLATLLDGGEENLEKNLPEFAVRLL